MKIVTPREPLLFRFTTLEAGLEFLKTGKVTRKGMPVPCVEDGDGYVKPNPEYVDAPFEVTVWTPEMGVRHLKGKEALDECGLTANVADVTPESRNTVSPKK